MENRIEKAVHFFSHEFNCSQSILAAYSPLWGMDEKTALKIATGFGAGMAALQKTCGAVTGAFMVLGLVHGKWEQGDDEAKKNTYSLVQNFAQEFIKENGSINCLTLLGANISTSEGLAKARDNNFFEIKCLKYIKDAAVILEKILDIPSQ